MWLDSPHHEVTLQSQRRIIRRSLSQSAGFLRAQMSDVTHHPMLHITSAHNIPTSNTILRCNIKSPPIYNTKPIFATYITGIILKRLISFVHILFNYICQNRIFASNKLICPSSYVVESVWNITGGHFSLMDKCVQIFNMTVETGPPQINIGQAYDK